MLLTGSALTASPHKFRELTYDSYPRFPNTSSNFDSLICKEALVIVLLLFEE